MALFILNCLKTGQLVLDVILIEHVINRFNRYRCNLIEKAWKCRFPIKVLQEEKKTLFYSWVLFQEKWATLIFIFWQEYTQSSILETVIVNLTKGNSKTFISMILNEYSPNILGWMSYAREAKQLLLPDLVLHDAQIKGVIFYPVLKFFNPGTVLSCSYSFSKRFLQLRCNISQGK